MKSRTAPKLFVIIGVAGLLLLGNGILWINNGSLFSGVAFCQPEEEEEPVQARPRPEVMRYQQGQMGPSGIQVIGDTGKPGVIGDTGNPSAMPAPIPTPPPPPKDSRTRMIGGTGNPAAAPAPIPMPPQPDPEDSRTGVIGDTGRPSARDDGEHGDGQANMRPARGTQAMQPMAPAQSTRPTAPPR